MFQKTAAEIAGRQVSEALPECLAATWKRYAERVFDGERLVLRERGQEVTYGLVWFPLHAPDGGTLFAGGYAFDVTPLTTAEQELRHTTLKMLQAQQAERSRLARFLHDDVGQCLSAVGLQLDLLRMDFEEGCPEVAPRTREMQQTLEIVMAGVRDYSYALNPDLVQRAGLFAALDRLAGRNRKEFSGILRFLPDTTLRFPPAVGSALYTIAQEAVENAIQHSGCSTIELIIKSTRNGPALEVRDNGSGFNSADLGGSHRGLGLLVMEHYAEQVGLRLSVDSEKGRGTVVRAVYESGSRE
jgi:signal transduction histidine kinase